MCLSFSHVQVFTASAASNVHLRCRHSRSTTQQGISWVIMDDFSVHRVSAFSAVRRMTRCYYMTGRWSSRLRPSVYFCRCFVRSASSSPRRRYYHIIRRGRHGSAALLARRIRSIVEISAWRGRGGAGSHIERVSCV